MVLQLFVGCFGLFVIFVLSVVPKKKLSHNPSTSRRPTSRNDRNVLSLFDRVDVGLAKDLKVPILSGGGLVGKVSHGNPYGDSIYPRIIGASKLAILRTLPLLYRFKPFHWRVQDP